MHWRIAQRRDFIAKERLNWILVGALFVNVALWVGFWAFIFTTWG